MESMINDPSFRDLVAKHIAEQMIAKSISPPLPPAAPPLPPAAPPLPPAAPVELPVAKPATLTIVPSAEAPDYIPLPKLERPLELSGKKRLADRRGGAATEFREPLTARQLIRQALVTSDPIPYSICINLNNLRAKLIPFLIGYTLDDLMAIKINDFLTRIVTHAYDIFVEGRPILKKLGVKLIPFGLHYYKYPTSRNMSIKMDSKVNSNILDFIDNYAKEYIISTFLQIITNKGNCRYYNYSVKVHPNWKKEITFCQINSISGIDLDLVMEQLFDGSFSKI